MNNPDFCDARFWCRKDRKVCFDCYHNSEFREFENILSETEYLCRKNCKRCSQENCKQRRFVYEEFKL